MEGADDSGDRIGERIAWFGGYKEAWMSETKPRVLLVDDEPDIVKTIGKRLEVAGFEVITAIDGQQALDRAHADHPDAMVLDLMLPKYSGLKVCSMLKQEDASKHIPIIIYTGKDQVVDQAACRDCGADAYIPKALGVSVLITEITALLKKAQESAPGRA